MRFLDRQSEMRRLMRLSNARKGGFVVIWGRRRIGKSEILKEWCNAADGLYTVADRSLPAVHRAEFASVIGNVFPGFGDVTYGTWKVLFEALSRRASEAEWHGPLVIDEFPYWAEADKTVVSVLQNWIDGEKRRSGILVAIAGSSQHMMRGLVIEHDAPLYGRADECMKMVPIGIDYISEALSLVCPLDAVKAYAVWGGIPRYWVAAERFNASLDDAVDELVLDPLGLFHDEPSTLLLSEIPSAAGLKPYLDVIGAGANRASEIAARLGIPITAISKPLSRLVDLGLVKREIPFGENEKCSKKSLYRLHDPFCRFWFEVMASRRSIFDGSTADIRRSVWKKLSKNVFATAWEDLARQFAGRSGRLAAMAGDDDFWMPAGRWWHGNERELDVVSQNSSKTAVLLGEAKWSEKPFSLKEVADFAVAFGNVSPPPAFHGRVVRALFLSAVECDVPDTVDGMPVITAADICRRGKRGM